MDIQPTDPTTPLSSSSSDEAHNPTVEYSGATVHFFLSHSSAAVPTFARMAQFGGPVTSVLLQDYDEDTERSVRLRWSTEYVDGGITFIQVVSISEPAMMEEQSTGSTPFSESRPAEGIVALPDHETRQFGFASGTLFYEGTRTVCVWEAAQHTEGDHIPATRLFVRPGVKFFVWVKSQETDNSSSMQDSDDDFFLRR